jgi:hypothetical protein
LVELTDVSNIPAGQGIQRVVVNFVDTETYEPVPVTINGEFANDYPMVASFSVSC